MTTSYLDSKRISGTTADRNGTPAVTGGWKELGRTTLGSVNSDISVASLADKRYYMILQDTTGSSTANFYTEFNGDTGSNYADRYSDNGAADGTQVNRSLALLTGSSDAFPNFGVHYIANLAAKEKLMICNGVDQENAGAGYAPTRFERNAKWANTSAAINRIDVTTNSAATQTVGSEVVVLGWDESDTHTTNFWEELASVDSTGDQTAVFSSAKKYIWIQVYVEGTSGLNFRMGNTTIDTGSNYSYRNSSNGGADGTSVSQTGLWTNFTFDALPKFYNFFMVNNASNEKLILGYTATQSTAGAGTAPNRLELAGKWANTSNQADRFQVLATTGTIGTNVIKVWGSN